MQSLARLLLLNVILIALLSGRCGNGGQNNQNAPSPSPTPTTVRSTALQRLPVTSGREVIFYPTFGYKDANGWNITVRGWVHENSHKEAWLRAGCEILCDKEEKDNCKSRTADLLDHDVPGQSVVIKFQSDPEEKSYALESNQTDGMVKLDLRLTDEQARQFLNNPSAPNGSLNGWITYRAVSPEHTGLGRVRLIEPGSGDSLISDIDDTIKITEIPAGTSVVLKNTFCHKLQPVVDPNMAQMYKDLGDIPVHYVSGGPERLYGPLLYDSLITGPGDYPEGTFHLRNLSPPSTPEARKTLIESAMNSLEATYNHKVEQIKMLMDKFPERKFILVGDSGEVDPEVYNEIRKSRAAQVKQIFIRDVVNDEAVNKFRLAGMTPIKVNPIGCLNDKHFKRLKTKVEATYPGEEYKPNAPPCASEK